MVKNAKKILGIVLTICMILSLNTGMVLAADASIKGEEVIFAPPSGRFSQIPYTFLDANGDKISGAKWSIEAAPNGIYLDGEKGIIAVDGSTVKGGSFTLKATVGSVSAEKSIEIQSARFFEDFEGQTVGAGASVKGKNLETGEASGTLTNGSSSKIGEDEEGNLYSAGYTWNNYLQLRPEYANSKWTKTRYVTIDLDVRALKEHNNNNATEGIVKESGGSFSVYVYNGNLSKSSSSATTSYTFPADWDRVYMILDYNTRTYTMHAGGDSYGPFDMGTSSYNYAWNLQLNRATDNFSMYSGAPAEIGIDADIPSVIKVGENGAKIPFAGGAKIGDANVPFEVSYNISSSAVTIEDGFLTVSPEALDETVTIEADAGIAQEEFSFDVVAAIEENSAVDVTSLKGLSVIKANVSGESAALSGFGGSIPLTCKEGGSSLNIYLNEWKNEYIAILDGKTLRKGEYTDLSTVSLSGTVEDFYAGTIYDEAPVALDSHLSGNAVVGQSLGVDYDLFSMLYEEESHAITWLLNGEEVSEEDYFLVKSDMIGSKLKAKIKVTAGGFDSAEYETEEATIADMYEVAKTADGVKVTVKGSGDETTFVVVISYIKDGKTVKTVSKKITTDEEEYVAPFTAGVEFDGARVCLLNSDLTPLAPEKFAGVTPDVHASAGVSTEGLTVSDGNLTLYDKSGQMTTLIIYNPIADKNFVSYNESLTATTLENDWTDKVSYISVVNADLKMSAQTDFSGAHMAVAIPASGEIKKAVFVNGLSVLFTDKIIETLSEDDFKKALNNAKGISAEEAAKIYKAYKLSDATLTAQLIAEEKYNLSELETTSLISAFLKNKENKDELIKNLTERKMETKGAELLYKNLDFSKSKSLLTLKGGNKKILEEMRIVSIIEGIKYAGNYLETKEYLENVGTYTITDSMAMAFTGTIFENIDQIKTAIETYTEEPEETPSGGGGGGGGGKPIGGTTTAGGFVGGSGGAVSSAPGAEQGSASSFSDVSSSHWAQSDISFLAEKKIISGMGDGSFKPENSITRAEFLKILATAFPINEAADAAEFKDVTQNDWYYEYVKKASMGGIVTGDGASFRPKDAISREDAAVMLYRVLSNLNVAMEEGENSLTDSAEISSYAQKAVSSLYSAGIINGMGDGSFMPKNNITRAQAAAIVARVLR